MNYMWHITHYLFQDYKSFSCYSLRIKLFVTQKNYLKCSTVYIEFNSTSIIIKQGSMNDIGLQTLCLEKGATIFLPVTLPNTDPFSRFFHRQTYKTSHHN